MRNREHCHPCADCRTPVECDGTWEANHDGWPEVICDLVDRWHATPLCEDCAKQRAIEQMAVS